jgi:hypothetical protein
MKMTNALHEVADKHSEIRRKYHDDTGKMAYSIAPLMMRAFKTKRFTRDEGVLVASTILAMVEVVDGEPIEYKEDVSLDEYAPTPIEIKP